MATSPTPSVLGSISSPARTQASSSSTAPAKDQDTRADKPSFSAALQDAQEPRSAPESPPEKTSDPAQKAPVAASTVVIDDAADGPDTTKNPLDALTLLKDAAAKGAATGDDKGKVLPLDGESLPTEDAALATLVKAASSGEPAEGAVTKTSTARKLAAANTAASAQAAPLTTAPITPVLPESSAGSASAALASSRSINSADGEEGGAATAVGIGDATTSQKREVPTSPQTLSLNQPSVSDSSSQSEASSDLGVLQGLRNFSGSISGSMSGSSAEKSGDATPSATFGDALKQIDSSMAAPAASSTAAIDLVGSSARDTGVRQYLDTSATAARVDLPVGKPGWSDAVADKVMWMSSQNINSAEIHLNPPDLGPLSVRVSTHHDQTSVFFTSSHATVRDALDQSLPRLREMMEGQGIQLLDAGVGGQGSTRQQAAQSEAFAASSRRGFGGGDDNDEIGVSGVGRVAVTQARPGLLDAYA